ncbi:MAG: PAS domain-containing sensor histidine kinase [Bdellovibrionota bacterium]
MLEAEKERLQSANKEVEKNKTLLTAIIENIPVAICLKDARDKFKVKLWNKTAEQLFEVPREAILEKNAHDLWPKEQAELYFAADEKVSREGFMVDVPEEPSQSKSRGLIYLHTKKLPLKIKGSPDSKYLLCICDDITETKRKDEKIIATLRQLETVADSMPGFISRCDLDGRYTFANKIYEEWYGIPKNEVVGRTQREVLPPKSYAQAEPNIKRAMKGERFSFEAVTTTKTGSDLNVFVSHIPDYDSQGKLSGYFNVVLDVTQIKQAQKQLLQSSKMSSLGEMAGGIAHEINNPLAVILGKAGSLKRRIEKGSFEVTKVCEDLAKIESYSERIAKIIKGLRSFSRNSENDPMTIAKVSTIVEDTLELCKERFHNHGVELRVNFDPALELECRPSQVAQILINLLGNAHDAIEKSSEKWVALDIVSEDELIRIKVTDSGTGIPKEVVDRMMEPFFTTKEVGKGTGLGLSISKGIAEDHGGQLRYDYCSKNTAFVLEIPRKQPNANSCDKKAA